MATRTHPRERTKSEGQQQNMLELGRKVEEHYTQPSPQATRHAPNFFPHALDAGIVLGLVLGVLAGLLVAWLLLSGRLAPEGWEGLFSLSPFTFYTFWALTGASLGLAIGGIVALLLAPVPEVEPGRDAAEG